jgi:hypothetical protein
VGSRLCGGDEHGGVPCGKHADEAAARQNALLCVSNSSKAGLRGHSRKLAKDCNCVSIQVLGSNSVKVLGLDLF